MEQRNDDDCWIGSSTPYIISPYSKTFFHIRFKNFTRGPAALNSLNLPCDPASKPSLIGLGVHQVLDRVFIDFLCFWHD